ncbi:MAG: hypothetical protein IIV81_04145, partial [Clostridia bacterium]|nr:hypothetical protein [Clostridia bacterium]
RLSFTPDGISLLLSWLGFVFSHDGIESERKLSPAECSYVGHIASPERKRQDWTNFELRGLIITLRKRGIKVYLSFFNYCSFIDENGKTVLDPFHKEHPEVYESDDEGYVPVNMLKRLSDGSFYEDVLQEKTVKALTDYGFDGIQIADGISSPRLTVFSSLKRDDILSQFEESSRRSIPLNADVKKYVIQNCYLEYINFLKERWNSFFEKFFARLEKAHKEALFNNAWTSSPFDALYRYGVDYKGILEKGAKGVVIEDVSGSVSILAAAHNGYLLTDEERRRVCHSFISRMMLSRALFRDIRILPIVNVHDSTEQWGVLEHIPTYMTTQSATNLNTLIYTKNGAKSVIDGPLFCLADSLRKSDWDFIRGVWENSFNADVLGNAGLTLVYSDSVTSREVKEFYENRRTPTDTLLTELKYAGSAVSGVVRCEDIPYMPKPFGVYSGALLVINPDLFDEDEWQRILDAENDLFVLTPKDKLPDGFFVLLEEENSFGGLVFASRKDFRDKAVVSNSRKYSFDSKNDSEPLDALWTHALSHKPYSNDFFIECAKVIEDLTPAPSIDHDITTEHGVRRRVCKYIVTQTKKENVVRLVAANDDYWYNLPNITFKKEIKKAKCLTKYEGYKPHLNGKTLTPLIALRGTEIFDIEF